MIVLLKAHNRGYTRKDGTYVKPFTDKRQKKTEYQWVWKNGVGKKVPVGAAQQAASNAKQHAQMGLFDAKPTSTILGYKPPAKTYAAYHPKQNEDGKPQGIEKPSTPTTPETWTDPQAQAVFVPGGAAPKTLNGVAMEKWEPPSRESGWANVAGQNRHLNEPEIDPPEGAQVGSGVIVVEPDGRVWVIDPTNKFGGYQSTFPKGKQDAGLSLQANAIKECFEESGLKVEITGLLGDFKRTTSYSRYYLARRVGGTPTDCGWETQAVRLVPKEQLITVLNAGNDKGIAKALYGLTDQKS